MSNILKKILLYFTILSVFTAGAPPVTASAKYYPMKVNYINVGESDSTLIQSAGKNMLIDAGDTDDTNKIIKYLRDKKIKTIDYLILTHPHEDHIAGADEVIRTFTIGKIIMPSKKHTTQAYENILTAIKNKGLKVTKPVVGNKYTIGKANFTIIAPNSSDYGNKINNYSVGIKLVNGEDSFVFIGDSETEAISDILTNKININADVILCGHHGSKTSTTSGLLKKVTPQYAILSVGKNNYGHPSDSTLKLLAGRKIKTYRTDKSGTIVATSTGTNITFNAKPTVYSTKASTATSNASKVVYITKTGKRYHLAGCSSLSRSKIKTTVREAKAKGLTPCNNCNPPK